MVTQSILREGIAPPPTNTKALSEKQGSALEELRYLCSIHKVCWEQAMAKAGPDGNDTTTLLRYLRARDYAPQGAFKQYSATVAWREKIQLDDMYGEAELAHFEALRRLFPQWTGRRDHRGVPVLAYRVSKIKHEDLSSTAKKDPSLSSVFLPAEFSTQFVQPLCAKMHTDKAMPCSIHIIDLTGVGVNHFWKLRNHLQKSSTMATAHYPESVDKIFIMGAPSFFPTIWGYIQKWFEPALTAKISVLAKSDVMPTLTKYMDAHDIPQWIGGGLEWDYGDHPNLDAEARAMVGSKLADNWVEGPLRVVTDEKGSRIDAVGKSRDETVTKIPADEEE